MPQQQHHPFHTVTPAETIPQSQHPYQHPSDLSSFVSHLPMIPTHIAQQRPQQLLQQHHHHQHQQQQPPQQYNAPQTLIAPPVDLQARQPQDHLSQQRVQRLTAPKQRPATHYGPRYNPMAAAPNPVSSMAHSNIPALSNIQLGHSPAGAQVPNYISSAQSSSSGVGSNQLFSSTLSMDSDLHSLSGSSGVSMNDATRSTPAHQASLPSWSSSHISGYAQSYEQQYPDGSDLMTQQGTTTNTGHPGLAPAAHFYNRSQHTPLYQMGIPLSDGSQFNYGSSPALSPTPLLGLATVGTVGSDFKRPAFDVKAYTFRKKSRHYVAVRQGNALRIEPIIYLKTSILDQQQDVVRNWDYLRLSPHRFRDNALPKKKLTAEEMRTARILDVDISLVSPNNKNRLIEDSCPACVMRMDGERKIMQVLAKNFKVTHTGEPVIDIRKGHAIVCIKLNCYSDHHNEQEGFVVRIQTSPSIVDMGSSVKLRICCEARSKAGTTEVEIEEEDGLTDIDAPASLGSRSPPGQERPAQSPSLSYGSESPGSKVRARQQSVNSSSVASPRSVDERVINSLAAESTLNGRNGGSASSSSGSTTTMPAKPPVFRKIYPLTPSEGSCLGGTRVTIHGANFDLLRNPVVYFGKSQAELVIVSHHDVMECTTPPAEGLKPGIVNVQIASEAGVLGLEADSVEFMYTVPPDYDLYNLAATSLSYAMANEYPLDDSLAFILRAHRSGAGLDPLQGWGVDQWTGSTGSSLDLGLSWTAKEDLVLDFLQVIQVLAPGRTLPAFTTETGHSLLHIAAQYNMARLAKELVAMGIDHTAVDKNQRPALAFAEMLSNTDMAQILSSAKVPPRPMVPPLVATAATRSSMKEVVASLIQKHEATLANVLQREQERKQRELICLRERSLRIMELKDQALSKETMDEDTEDARSSPALSSLDEVSPERELSVDEIGRKRKSQIDTAIGWTLAKKLNIETSPPLSAVDLLSVVDSGRMSFIKNGCQLWERERGAQLFGDLVSFGKSAGLQIWACDSVTLTSFDSTSGDYLTAHDSKDTSLAVLALSTTGLHLFKEDSVSHDRVNKSLENWSLFEIERMDLLGQDSEMMIRVDMCGLVPRGGRNLLGERIEIKSIAALTIFNAISEAKTRLDQHQRVATRHCWAESQLKLWSTLFGVEAREFDAVLTDHLDFEEGVLTMKPVGVDRRGGHSMPMIGAVVATIRFLDNCESVDFSGVRAEDDGWSKPELIRQLQRTVQTKEDAVVHWNFSNCGWTAATFQGFARGFSSTGAEMRQSRRPCSQITLAGNQVHGDDSAGHALVDCIKRISELEALDITDCDIGLVEMDNLIHHIRGLVKLRIRGNRSDQRWWTWMDTLLQRNPKLQHCHIGAPIKVDSQSASLLSLERLQTLNQLVELDLTDSWVTVETLETLARYLRVDASRHVKTLTLSHCQLDWSPSLTGLFRTICDINTSTKFTLAIGRNPLFDKEESVQAWIAAVEGSQVNVPFGIQMTDLVMTDFALQQILGPLAAATCFNELDFKGLYVKQDSQVPGPSPLSYDEMRLHTVPVAASPESCRALSRILECNSTLVMLDISGTTVKDNNIAAAESMESVGRSIGGFGRHVSLALPALGQNSTLRILALDHNRFGEEGLPQFCQALRSNQKLGVLTCDGNDIFTPQGLCAIERIFSPAASSLSSLPAVASISAETLEAGRYQPAMIDADPCLAPDEHQQYNRTLCVWKHGQDEILMHVQLLTLEVTRLVEERDRLEKRLSRVSDVKILSDSLEDMERRVAVAQWALFEYSETHARIVKAISNNNERVKRAL